MLNITKNKVSPATCVEHHGDRVTVQSRLPVLRRVP